MYVSSFKTLKEAYSKARELNISEDQFAALVYTFPSILVAYSDGKIDMRERRFLRFIPEVLAEEENESKYKDVSMTQDYFNEVNYLLSHLEQWELPFLEVLKAQLHESSNEKNAIFRAMWQTADSSEDICESEKSKIKEICDILEL